MIYFSCGGEIDLIKVNLKQLLKKKGMTMTELHELTGITQNTLSLMANGKSNGIQFNTLDKILKATNSNINDLLEQTGELYELFVQREEEKLKEDDLLYFTYRLIARKNQNDESNIKIHFFLKHYSIDNRKFVHIVYDKHELLDSFDELLIDNIFHPTDESDILVPLSYLFAFDMIHHIQLESLSLNSLILFTWDGFVPLDYQEIYILRLTSRDPIVSLDFNEKCFDVLPDVNYLERFYNIESVKRDFKTGKYSIEMYFS